MQAFAFFVRRNNARNKKEESFISEVPMDQDADSYDFSFSERNSDLFYAHFSMELDDQTAVLKAHLLIETMLRDFCLKSVRDPSPLQEARLSFKQIALLARSLCWIELSGLGYCWVLVDKVNSLRNMMAHELEPDPARMTKIKDSILTIIKQNQTNQDPEVGELKHCLGYLCGMLDALLQASLAFVALEKKRMKSGSSQEQHSPTREA